jgi:hypothetical protein
MNTDNKQFKDQDKIKDSPLNTAFLDHAQVPRILSKRPKIAFRNFVGFPPKSIVWRKIPPTAAKRKMGKPHMCMPGPLWCETDQGRVYGQKRGKMPGCELRDSKFEPGLLDIKKCICQDSSVGQILCSSLLDLLITFNIKTYGMWTFICILV